MPRYSVSSVSVPNTALTDVATMVVDYLETFGAEVTVATNALAGFAILGRFHPAGDWVTLYSASGDFTSPKGILMGCSGDLTAQAVGNGWFLMSLTGLESIKIQAKSANAGGSTVSIKACAK